MFDDWDTHIVPFSFPDMKYSAIPFLAALLTVSGLHASPPQYLSQLHTEILGRLPSAEEWNRYEKGFATENFEIPSAEGVAIAFFGSQEWRNLKYSSVETSYVLYRSLLLREPSTEEMRLLSAQVERSGGNLSGIVKDLVRSQEFKDRVNGMIARPNGHGYFANRPSHRPSLGSTGQGNGYLADLQAALNQTPAGGTCYLAQGALIELDGTLEVPANVTLATFDSTSASKLFQKPNQYAKMARIVRANVFDGELVRLQPGSRLVGVWVDGRRSQLRTDDPSLLVANASSSARNTNAVNIVLVSSPSGDTPTEIIACKISDSSGWTNILTRGSDGAWAPGAARITRNIITCYSANRDLVESFFTDGISSTASDAHITENAIVDPSDVGIVVFNPWMPSRQNSQIVGNDIFFAGNNGWGGITLDHNAGSECLCTSSPLDCGAPKVDCRNALDESITCDFSNTLVSDNTIRSSKYAYANVGISVGVHLWGLPMYGRGSQVVSNRVGLPSMPLVSAIGIVIAGFKDPVVLNNSLSLTLDPNLIAGLSAPLVLDPTCTQLGAASAIQAGFVTADLWGALRPKSNGYITGEFEIFRSDVPNHKLNAESERGIAHLADDRDMRNTLIQERWNITQSNRNFGDGQAYFVLNSRSSNLTLTQTGGAVTLAPFDGSASQYWRIEAFSGHAAGGGVLFVNMANGAYLSRDASGLALLGTDRNTPSAEWNLSRFESRPLSNSKNTFHVVDQTGEIIEIRITHGKVQSFRYVGNPASRFGWELYADPNAADRPVAFSDFNRDGYRDLWVTNSDTGDFKVVMLDAKGIAGSQIIGNINAAYGVPIGTVKQSWYQVLGTIPIDSSGNEDIVIVDREGNLMAGLIGASGFTSKVDLGNAAQYGLNGLRADPNASIKCIGSGDFRGNGRRSLLMVDSAGEQFMLSASNGRLENAQHIGNPKAKFGWGTTALASSDFIPVGIADVDMDKIDDVILIDNDGNLLAYTMKAGTPTAGAYLGNPRRSWEWRLSSIDDYTRPLSVTCDTGWWNW